MSGKNYDFNNLQIITNLKCANKKMLLLVRKRNFLLIQSINFILNLSKVNYISSKYLYKNFAIFKIRLASDKRQ